MATESSNFAPGQHIRLDVVAHDEGGFNGLRRVPASTSVLEVLAVTQVAGEKTMVTFRTLRDVAGADVSRLPPTVGNFTQTFPLAAHDAKLFSFSVL
jgi:hypothetical protein